MAVIYESITGTDLIRAYSDAGFKIISDETGFVYTEAIDPDFCHRTYTESTEPIEDEEEEQEEEISDEEAYRIIMGENL